VKTLVGLFLGALAARVLTALPFPDPAYPDSTYYVAVARELAAGHGFQVPYVWQFVDVGGHLPTVGTLPIPSNAHWAPLASIVQVPFIWLLGPTWLASSLPFWILGALAAPLTYLLALDAGLPRRLALPAALLMVLPAAAAPFFSQPDNFALYLVLGVAALWLCARALRGQRWAFAAGGIAVGLATLARTDGVLLAAPFLVAFVADRWRAWRGRSAPQPSATAERPARWASIGWAPALGFAALFLIVMAPWWARQLAVFGSISPSSVSGRILWIRTYEQQFSVGDVTTPATFFAQGWWPLLSSRISGFLSAVVVLSVTPLLIFLVPLTLVGAWVRRRDPAFQPWMIYATTFFVATSLVFAVHLANGLALHSGMALVPYAYLLAMVGIEASVGWVAARRPSWDARRATRNFTALAVAVAWLFALAGTWKVTAGWQSDVDTRNALMDAHPIAAAERLMSADPGSYWYHWGMEGVVTPNDPLPVVEETLRRYDIRWLALEADHIQPALTPILQGTERPSWLSAPVAVVREDATTARGSATAGAGPTGLPRAALYAVCLTPGDTRCAPSS